MRIHSKHPLKVTGMHDVDTKQKKGLPGELHQFHQWWGSWAVGRHPSSPSSVLLLQSCWWMPPHFDHHWNTIPTSMYMWYTAVHPCCGYSYRKLHFKKYVWSFNCSLSYQSFIFLFISPRWKRGLAYLQCYTGKATATARAALPNQVLAVNLEFKCLSVVIYSYNEAYIHTLSLTHTHTHTQMDTHTHSLSQSHITHTLSHTHTLSLSRTHSLSLSHKHTLSLSQTLILMYIPSMINNTGSPIIL